MPHPRKRSRTSYYLVCSALTHRQPVEIKLELTNLSHIVRLVLVNNGELTGIGTFTVLDAGNVTPEDAGNNFFLTQKSIGTSRADEITKLLGELNENVKGIADTRVRLASFEFPSFASLLLSHHLARLTTDGLCYLPGTR